MNNVAHELRTPLAVMRTKVDSLSDEAARLTLTTDVSRLTTIVSSMLQLARLHNTELPFEPLRLNALARDAVSYTHLDVYKRQDHASIALPFGRGCILWSEPLYVRKAADAREVGLIAMDISERLDDLHATAQRNIGRER